MAAPLFPGVGEMRIAVKELGALIVTSFYLPTESGVMVSAVADLGDLYVGAGVSVIDVLETGGIRDAWNWTGVENIEFAPMARAALSNGMRLVGVLGYFAPAAFKPLYYRRARSISLMPDPTETHSGTPAAVGTAPWAHRCGEKGKRIKHAGIFVIGVLSILYIGVILFFRGNDAWALLRAGNLNELGDFLAGLSAPIAFGWLVYGYLLQSKELHLQREDARNWPLHETNSASRSTCCKSK